MTYVPEVKRRLVAFLNKHNVSFEAFAILEDSASTSHQPPDLLLKRVVKGIHQSGLIQCLTPAQARVGLGELLCKGMVQVVSEATLLYIESMLDASNVELKYPAAGLPELGDIDLTFYGKEFHALIQEEVFDSVGKSVASIVDMENGRQLILSNDFEYAKSSFLDWAADRNPETQPVMCGPWFERWWLLHSEGWKIPLTDDGSEEFGHDMQ